jgi:hypothetical protein
MFIKKSNCNYNALEFLSNASRLIFALDAWVALIVIMELIVVFFLAEKKHGRRDFDPLFWVYMIIIPLVQLTIMIPFLIILSSLSSHEPTIEH